MNDPAIRYCVTADGVSIAWMAMGDGPYLVLTPPGPVGHIAGELRVSDARTWYERLARSFTIVRYDPRGSGSSDRERLDDEHAGRVLDLLAVLEAVDSPSNILAALTFCPAAIEVSAWHPDRVSKLILWDAIARPSDYTPSARLMAARSLIERDWRAYTDAWIQSGFGWNRAESAREWSRWLREATTPEAIIGLWTALHDHPYDVMPLLPSIKQPVLVVGHPRGGFTDLGVPKRLASQIPNGQLVMLEGNQMTPAMQPDLADDHAMLVERFLGVATPTASRPAAGIGSPVGTSIILFADIADSTAITERVGDAAFRERARALDDDIRARVREHNGTVIDAKTLGDGILATFQSATQAIAAARACAAAGDARSLPLHLGLHAGDVIREDGNVFGGAVNIAARVSALSASGEILVTDVVRALARTSAGAAFDDRGEHTLKGVADPHRIYAVRKAAQ